MNQDNLKKYIQNILPMSLDKVDQIVLDFENISIKKNIHILQENQVSKNSFFLEKGIVRSYTYDIDKNEVTTNIFTGPCFATDFLSFFKQQPSSENYQTLSECVIWTMSFEVVQKNFHNVPEFREFGRMMLVTNYSILHERMLGMIKDTAHERYKKLLQNQPEVFKHVPLKIIASFLGITDSSLSRIRKEIG